MKLLIATIDPTLPRWPSLPQKLRNIRNGLNNTPNATWTVEAKYFDIIPEVNAAGRIPHDWFNDFAYPLFREGNHLVNLHMSMRQWDELGLRPTLRGSNHVDNDFVGQSYLRADEHTERGNTGENQFEQVNMHEGSHQLSRDTGVPDETHSYHDANPDISGIFHRYDMANWHPEFVNGLRRKRTLLEEIIALMGPRPFDRPLPTHWENVSQPYGVPNPTWYPITGHHIGVDFPTPVGTPIFAPTLCRVTRGEYWPNSLGHWCEVELGGHYLIFAHLDGPAFVGERQRGWIIGFTGNSGMSRGPHCHVEWLHQPMDRSMLSPSTWRTLTGDVTKLIK